MEVIAENACPTQIQVEQEQEFDTCSTIRFSYEGERGNTVLTKPFSPLAALVCRQ